MTSVGEKLRRERIRQGIDLTALAADLRINLKYLEAIESSDPAGLPGGFFYRSFVRQYANALGMDGRALEAELEQVREAEAPTLYAALEAAPFPVKQLDPIVSESNRKLANGRTWAYVLLLAGVLVGCSAFYGWWHRLESGERTVAQAPQNQPASTVAAVPNESATVERVANDPAQVQAPQVSVSQETGPDDKVVITVSVREKTWLAISSDGKQVFSGILEPSQKKILGGKSKAWMRVGNAGGLEITWNGKAIGPIGPRGQVRTVLFTPENYQILPVGGSL